MKAGILILFLISLKIGTAQNLVPNAGFEQYYRCPGSYNPQGSDPNFAPGWVSPTLGTPDIFNRCSFGNAGVPHNWAGVANAHKGFGYAGIYAFLNNSSYREYLQAKLTDSLKEGRTYGVEFFIRLSGYSKYAVDRIGVLLSDSSTHAPHDRIWKIQPSFTHVMDSAYSKDTGLWNRIYFEYKAHGGEKFITLGNFSTDKESKVFHLNFSQANEPMLNTAAYFYIDDVSVVALGNPETQTAVATKDLAAEPKPNEVYILQHIYFSFNSADILPQSYEELNTLVAILKKNPKWNVELSGHTDDKGDNLYNYNLSLNRAKSVGRYLVGNGVAIARIKVLGFGKRKPLKLAKTEEARAINRRVEAKFLEK